MNDKSKVLITGGAGLVGSHIADALVREGVGEVRVLDNFTRGRSENLNWAKANGNVNVIEGDICDKSLVKRALEGVELLFHQAAIRITQCAEEPRLALEVLVDGTFTVLESAVEMGVGKVVAASSASAYGLAESFPTNERHHPYNNDTFYGAAKVFNEGMYRSFYSMYELNYVALRYFNVYGPRMDIHGVYTEVLIRWMERIAAGHPPVIFGDGSQTMDFVYITDIAQANILAANTDVTDTVYNVARGEEISLKDLAQALLKTMDSNLDIEFGPERTVNSVTRRLADTHNARSELGFSAKVSLEEGLSKLVEWWHSERKA